MDYLNQLDQTQDEGPSISTLRINGWRELCHGYPDTNKVQYLLDIVQHGANIQCDGQPSNTAKHKNLQSAHEYPKAVDEFLQKEIELDRISGPFNRPPLDNMTVSPLGVVAKDNGKMRVIVHYSYPEGDSVNDAITSMECSLQSFEDAMQMMARKPPSTQMVKIDVKSAFRLIPVREADQHLLGMKWKGSYYVDKRLPFGLSTSPPIWERFSRMIHWILEQALSPDHIVHYVDDFLIAVPIGWTTAQVISLVQLTCHALGVPLADDKSVCGTSLTFLGLLLDSTTQTAQVPADKLQQATAILTNLLNAAQVPQHELATAIGKLQFLSKVFPYGRSFLFQLRRACESTTRRNDLVPIDLITRSDIRWWKSFLPKWDGISLWLDPAPTLTTDINFHLQAHPPRSHAFAAITDASSWGMGSTFGNHWFQLEWTPDITHLKTNEKAATYLELLAIVIAINTWGPHLHRKRLILYSDCLGAAYAVRRFYSPNVRINQLLQMLAGVLIRNHCQVTLLYIQGETNIVCDILSRTKVQTLDQYPQFDPKPTIPNLNFLRPF